MAKRQSSKLSWLIGGGIVAVAAAAVYYISVPDTLVYFYTPDEALAQVATISGKTVRVGGMVKGGTVDKNLELPLVKFTLWDMKGSEFEVQYKGLPPDMFKENAGVVVEGRIEGTNTLVAKNLLVKHSEEYKKPDATHSMNKDLIEKSMFKE